MDFDRSSGEKRARRSDARKTIHAVEAAPVATAQAGSAGIDMVGLFRAEQSSLYRTARRYLRNPEDAADVVQDAFARLLQARAGTTIRTPAAYLQRIVRNLLRDRFKRAKARMTFCDVTTCEAQAMSVPAEQGWAIEAEQLAIGYAEAVASLPSKTRAVFLLHRVDGLRYREIAAQLGITTATVEYHMARALLQLDRALNR